MSAESKKPYGVDVVRLKLENIFSSTLRSIVTVKYERNMYFIYDYSSSCALALSAWDIQIDSFCVDHYLSFFADDHLHLPCWFFFSSMHQRLSLKQTNHETLLNSLSGLSSDYFADGITSDAMIAELLDIMTKIVLQACYSSNLHAFLQYLTISFSIPFGRFDNCHPCISCYMERLFGDTICNLLRIPELSALNNYPVQHKHAIARELLDAISENDSFTKGKSQFDIVDLQLILQTLHPSVIPKALHNYKDHAMAIINALRTSILSLSRFLCTRELHHLLLCWDVHKVFDERITIRDCLLSAMEFLYSDSLLSYFLTPVAERPKLKHLFQPRSKVSRQPHTMDIPLPSVSSSLMPGSTQARLEAKIIREWPQLPTEDVCLSCAAEYRRATAITVPKTCACCARQRIDVEIQMFSLNNITNLVSTLNLNVLHITRSSLSPDFQFHYQELCDLMLDRSGMIFLDKNHEVICFCMDCLSALYKSKVPKFSLANNLYRGQLPNDLIDLTWIEEMACAIYTTTAHVARLYQSNDPRQPRVFKGNVCAHEMNVISTASVLPRTPSDLTGCFSLVFVGPRHYLGDCLGTKFRARRKKIWKFLLFLTRHNDLYKDITLSNENLNMYSDDDILPGLIDRVLVNDSAEAREFFDEETAGLTDHPSNQVQSANGSAMGALFLEKLGVSDPDCVRLEGRSFTAAALRHLSDSKPDMIIHHGQGPIAEYDNTSLFPGMYPTLFPYGLGGFEDQTRHVAVAFQPQAEYFLDLHDKSFRTHHSFIFVALNIYQRRLSHLYTALTVSTERFERVAHQLLSITPETLTSVAKHVEKEGNISDLNEEQKNVMLLLKEVNTVASKLPGSDACKLKSRNEILSYQAMFGVPTLYFTANPCPVHSPMFQVLWGDETINLDNQFPLMVDATDRAMRLAQDPVAAADFFDISIRLMFDCLFGWDFKLKKSKEAGGIIGHLKAFFGSGEYTERGSLHGHFLLWLIGALNPSELHQRLMTEPGFDNRLFNLFDNIIHHHLPSLGVEISQCTEPRAERPPLVCSDESTWQSLFWSDVEKCGELLQRHKCRPVCHKYGNENKCRFLFPHEVVRKSYFDCQTNSVVFQCLDPNINYFNPYILVFCRHNHDIRCLLSGKAAKAAAYYITDYITKTELKTYHVLSLLSKGVISARAQDSATDAQKNAIQKSKTLLHKCLSQFARQHQIHAQQAARYLRGKDDCIKSHDTVPMLSSLLINFVKNTYNLNLDSDVDSCDVHESMQVRISLDKTGSLVRSNQVQNYFYRESTLDHVCFYDFVARFRIEKISEVSKFGEQAWKRFRFMPDHPMYNTHQIVECYNKLRGDGLQEKVPRIIGMNVPRPASPIYQLFIIAHFKPFSIRNALVCDASVSLTFDSFSFTTEANTIIKNWIAMQECEDERDAERLRKRSYEDKLQHELQHESMQTANDDLYTTHDELVQQLASENVLGFDIPPKHHRTDFIVKQLLLKLQDCHYLHDPYEKPSTLNNEHVDHHLSLPDITVNLLKKWNFDIKQQANIKSATRLNEADAIQQIHADVPITETETAASLMFRSKNTSPFVLSTEYQPSTENFSHAEILGRLCIEHSLTDEQAKCFYIIAQAVVRRIAHTSHENVMQQDNQDDSMRMLMTGGAGTGKSYVIDALRHLMQVYNHSHAIKFIAPTGASAVLIKGTTIHSSCYIPVFKKGRRVRQIDGNNSYPTYTVNVSVKDRQRLREDYKSAIIVVVDEISLVDQALYGLLDQTLRYAMEKNEPFGGLIMIFSGDFFQYPPVGGSPLYKPISNCTKDNSDLELLSRLGRMAWRNLTDVVILHEQKRMHEDPEYGDAVSRLRKRTCTINDVDLFNSRVVKSDSRPDGVDIGEMFGKNAIVVVPTNKMREAINHQKAQTLGGNRVVLCAAHDTVEGVPFTGKIRSDILNCDFSFLRDRIVLPSFLSFYEGMPVVLRHKNINTELGIVNGASGILRKLNTANDESGFSYMTSAIVEFPCSDVHISGLPPKFFPLQPETCTLAFREKRNAETIIHRFQRSQAPFEPAFALTGHAIQGYTAKEIITMMQKCTFGAYVAASRPRTRCGLAITDTVTLQDLNTPLPYHLMKENERQEAIAMNTLIRHGFANGPLQAVPDPEEEKHVNHINFPRFIVTNDTPSRKRKIAAETNDEQLRKRGRKS